MKKLFCIVGKSGSGKSTILDYLTDVNNKKSKDINLGRLVYHTTRTKREGEVDGFDYHFEPAYDTPEFYNVYDESKVLEVRMYRKVDETVLYYTTISDINESENDILVCAASVDQLLSYYNKMPDNVYAIEVDVSLRTRINRLINRAEDDTQLKELCRRVGEEENEFERIEMFDQNKILHLMNEDMKMKNDAGDYTYDFISMISKVYEFINSNT